MLEAPHRSHPAARQPHPAAPSRTQLHPSHLDAPSRTQSHPVAPIAPAAPLAPAATADLKDAFLAQLKAAKVFFYNTVVAQAYRIDVSQTKITFTFLPNQKVPKQQCEDMKSLLEDIAQKVSGHKIPVSIVVADALGVPGGAAPKATAPPCTAPRLAHLASLAPLAPDEESLRREAMSDPSVQALFEIFPVQKSKVEEL